RRSCSGESVPARVHHQSGRHRTGAASGAERGHPDGRAIVDRVEAGRRNAGHPAIARHREGRDMTRRILIVDDDPRVRSAIALLLEEEGYQPVQVESGPAALEAVAAQEFELILSDVAMPGMDGIELLAKLRKDAPDVPVVMISAHGDLETAVRAVREGAYDYLVKPIDDQRLYHTIDKALELHQLRKDYVAIKDEARADDLLGDSPPMNRLREEIRRAAPSEARILILGENGTGKEL